MLPRSAALLLALAALLVPAAAAQPLRMSGPAFGGRATIEVRDLPAAQAEPAIRDALARIGEVEGSLDGDGEIGLGALNAAAGQGPVPVAPELALVLARALDFCRWSGGAYGPLIGPVPAPPAAAAPSEGPRLLDAAPALLACEGLAVDLGAGTAELAAGRQADLRGFGVGHAVDEAVALLAGRGAADLWVEVDSVRRAIGPGPGGRGWPTLLASSLELRNALAEIHLRDRALAVAASGSDPSAGNWPPFMDLRTGRPAAGTLAVAATSRLAVDAQGLATILLIIGSREGQHLLGALRPSPSVLWALGAGSGQPLFSYYNWSEMR